MSSTRNHLQQIAQIAQRIYNQTSLVSGKAAQIAAHRQPVLQIPRLGNETRSLGLKPSDEDWLHTLYARWAGRCRLDVLRSYQNCITKLQSLREYGLDDSELEDQVIRHYEAVFRRLCNEGVAIVANVGRRQLDQDSGDKANGFSRRTTTILDASFAYTQNPTNAEVDHLSRLTGLTTSQVRTWFQNKRNRRAKQERLRAASGSTLQGPTQPQVKDGRRVASLPSRAKKANGGGRVTRPLPKRLQAQVQTPVTVPLERTTSHDSDSTTFSWSSIPSNGGFTGFTYPTASTVTNPVDLTITPSEQVDTSSYFPSSCFPTDVGAGPDLSSFLGGNVSAPPSVSPVDNLNSINLEEYLNFNIDNLAPPVDDFTANLDSEIQAALRTMDATAFNNLNLTLAPSPSTSSPVSDFSAQEWFPELSPAEAESMEMLKVYLDGMDFVTPPLDSGDIVAVGDHSSPAEVGQTSGSEGLPSGQTSPQDEVASMDFGELPFSLELNEPMELEVEDKGVGCSSGSGSRMDGKEGEGWMLGVLPFEMMSAETWIEA